MQLSTDELFTDAIMHTMQECKPAIYIMHRAHHAIMHTMPCIEHTMQQRIQFKQRI